MFFILIITCLKYLFFLILAKNIIPLSKCKLFLDKNVKFKPNLTLKAIAPIGLFFPELVLKEDSSIPDPCAHKVSDGIRKKINRLFTKKR